jgi:hypothetical protein
MDVRLARLLLVLILIAHTLGGFLNAADQPLGQVRSTGAFRIDHTQVVATGTVFEGSTVETDSNPAVLSLVTGATVNIAPKTSVSIGAGKLALSDGGVQVHGVVDLQAPPAKMVAHPLSADTTIHLQRLNDRMSLNVTSGSAAILNGNTRVAQVPAGNELHLQFNAAEPLGVVAVIKGCLKENSDGLYIVDVGCHSPFQLAKNSSAANKGNTVEIIGSLRGVRSSNSIAEVVVLSEKRLDEGCGRRVPIIPIVAGTAAVTAAIVIVDTRNSHKAPVSIP